MKKVTAVFVVGHVKDFPNRNSYQRISALSERYLIVVVTTHPLPSALTVMVEEVNICKGAVDMCRQCLIVGKNLREQNRPYYIHTQYAPFPLIAGYLCNKRFNCVWVYDLWDHPSLAWSSDGFARRIIKKALWWGILRRMLVDANAWIIGMSPTILNELPKPSKRCRILFKLPGIEMHNEGKIYSDTTSALYSDEIVICYAGKLTAKRGADLIINWAKNYEGTKVRLELMGTYDESFKELINTFAEKRKHDSGVQVKLYGNILHSEVLRILETADIGICLIDPTVLNYRYAYPIKVAEYLSRGLVTVATEGYGVRGMIISGKTGFIASYNQNSFAQQMDFAISICQNEERKREIASCAREKAKIYDRQVVNQELLDELDDLLLAVFT